MSSDYNSFLTDARKIAVSALKFSDNPSRDAVHREAQLLVEKRIGQATAHERVPIDADRAKVVVDALARCASAMVEQWHIAKGSGAWPPMA